MSDSEGFDTHESLINVSVASRNLPLVFIVAFFAFPRNWDTVSQPLKAYQKSTAQHISFPKALALSMHWQPVSLYRIQSKVLLSPNPTVHTMQLQQHQYLQSL